MRILVVHYQVGDSNRNTIDEHLYSFKNYSNHDVIYLNAFIGVPPLIQYLDFDVVLFHYTFLAQKWNGRSHFKNIISRCQGLKKIEGLKIAMPQDEYVNSEMLCEFFREFDVKILFTCLEESEWYKVYPTDKSGIIKYVTTLTGYVDEKALEKIHKFCQPIERRTFDIGYRARKLPFWLGEHGTIKWRLTEVFQKALPTTNLKADISNDEKKVFLGDDWYRFLGSCRTVLGCEGGASLHDFDGRIRARVDQYCEENPHASFEEVRESCFPEEDYNLKLFAISPRHFEACMTKTTQILVEGNYFNIFKPDAHYIELKKDWSNLDEVLAKVQDQKFCEEMAERAHRDIIQSGKYTYASFVDSFFKEIGSYVVATIPSTPFRRGLARLFFCYYPVVFSFFSRKAYQVRVVGFKCIQFLGLVPLYRKMRSKVLGWEF